MSNYYRNTRPTVMRAKRASDCPECSLPIGEGMTIRRVSEHAAKLPGRWVHQDCTATAREYSRETFAWPNTRTYAYGAELAARASAYLTGGAR